MFSKSIDVDGVKATVHTETGLAAIIKQYLSPKVYTEDGLEWDLWYWFIRAIAQSDQITVPFVWPNPTDSIETLKAARAEWYKMSGNALREWQEALKVVDTSPGDVDLAPVIDEKKSETPTSPENEISLEAS